MVIPGQATKVVRTWDAQGAKESPLPAARGMRAAQPRLIMESKQVA